MSDVTNEPVNNPLLIVVGASLTCEMEDRPLGYRLREAILRWQDDHLEAGIDDGSRRTPAVLTDLWYLNTTDLMMEPALCVGEPSSNAATAFHASKLPTAFVMEEVMRVQLDPEYIDTTACIWGVNHAATVSAVDLFIERYLPPYLAHLHHLPTDVG
ncbi:MAG: hypothetical protein AAF432_10380 [Planctomycetota bacterium]